jgi:hypothetical protein
VLSGDSASSGGRSSPAEPRPQQTNCPGFRHDDQNGGPSALRARSERPGPPRVSFQGEGTVVLDDAAGKSRPVELHKSAGNWTLMSVFVDNGQLTAVFEEVGRQDGQIAYVGDEGVRLVLGKSLEPTGAKGRAWYLGHAKEEVLPGRPDVLRRQLLEDGRDADPEAVRRCFPPVRRAFWEGIERPHTFVGTPSSADVVPHYYIDVPMVARVPTLVVAPEAVEAIRAEEIWEGLVGGWLPVVRTVYPFGADECWELVVFATPEGATTFLQPTWYRFLRLKGGQVTDVKYIDSHLPSPDQRPAEPAEFYRHLARLHSYWDRQLAGAMKVDVPDAWVADFCRHAIVLERITRRGDHPKYGVVERAYAGEEHDGFPDLLTSTVICNLEWGLFATARSYLDYYFKHFVRTDGTVRYRGPEMGKYGVILACLALYFDYTEDPTLLCEHDQKIKAMTSLLTRRWEDARHLSPSHPAYGMIKGPHEADISFLRDWEDERRLDPSNPAYEVVRGQDSAAEGPSGKGLDATAYDQPYLSNSPEAWRGLRDIALSWQKAGERLGDAEMASRGASLNGRAAALFDDARRGIQRSWLEKDGVVGLPIIAGSSSFYWEAPYRTSPASFDENRVWSELLHSGVATKDTVSRLLDIAGERGGTTLGVFNNRVQVVGFLVAEAVQGLLQHDLVPEALLAFYAHAFHAHTRGTWTAIECVDMDRDRGFHSPYCAPAQMTVPTIAKWLLVFEDPLSREITLGLGAPRAWLADGEGFGVTGAPTRWGPLSYRVSSRLAEGEIDAEVRLPPRPGATVQLRLRCPQGYMPARAVVMPHGTEVDAEADKVRLPAGSGARLTLRVACVRRQDTT